MQPGPQAAISARWPRCRRRARTWRRHRRGIRTCSSPTTTRRRRASSRARVSRSTPFVQRLQAAGIEATPLAGRRRVPFAVRRARAGAARGIHRHAVAEGAVRSRSTRTRRRAHTRPTPRRHTPARSPSTSARRSSSSPRSRRCTGTGRASSSGSGRRQSVSRLTAKILAERPHAAISIDEGGGLAGLLGALGQLACAGVTVDLRPLFERRSCRIGNPDQLESLVPTSALPKHAWMLNGSYARRADEPQRQIGVTLEQVSAQQASPPIEAPLGRAGHGLDRARGERRHQLSRGATRAPGLGHAPSHAVHAFKQGEQDGSATTRTRRSDSAVMAEYFETMRQFLETQERVMTAFMTRRHRRRSPAPCRDSEARRFCLGIRRPVWPWFRRRPRPQRAPVPRPPQAGATPQAVRCRACVER